MPAHARRRTHPPDLPRAASTIPLVLAAMSAQSLLVVLSPTLVEIAHEFATPVASVGAARAIAAASAVAASVLIAKLIDRAGLRCLLTAGAALAAAGSATIALAPALVPMLAAHALTGVAFACLLSAGLAGVAAFPREQTARATGQVIGANALAWIVVAPLGGLLTDIVGWRAAYAVPAALALAALAAARRVTPLPATAASGARDGLLAVIKHRQARRWVVAELGAWFVWGTVLTYGGAFLIERHAASEPAVGAAFAVAAAGFFIGSVRSATLLRRFPRRAVIVSAAAVAMSALVPLQFCAAPSLGVTVAVLCLIALCNGLRTSVSAGLGLDQIPGRAATMMTAQTAVTQLGYLLGALVGAAMLGSSGYASLGLVLGAALIVSAALLIRVADPLQERDRRVASTGGRLPMTWRAREI